MTAERPEAGLAGVTIDKIGLFVSNYEASLRFYRDKLGLSPVWESPDDGNAGFLVGYNLLIVQVSESSVVAGGARLYFTVSNIVEQRFSLQLRGIDVPEIRDLGFAKFLDFADPDGNRLALFEPAADYVSELEGYLGRKLESF